MGVAALNHDSQFQAAYERGIKKNEYWTYVLEDCLNLVAKLPALAARIYRNVYHPNKAITPVNKNLDLVGKFEGWSHGNDAIYVLQQTTRTCLDSVTMKV